LPAPSPERVGIAEPWKIGSLFRPSGRLLGVVCWICSVETTVTGVGALVAIAVMREPVTVTASTTCESASAVAGAACWAKA
jgi:hypothetical protein